ncbi:MAG: peptidoglycan DD-metalloendopeptidase family protein [Saprospiraceae bacterium]|nr:peptidoglycan DD-metalloendopeptidase family protein [Saprospiraceae bacterium]
MSKLKNRYIDIAVSLIIASFFIFNYHAEGFRQSFLNSDDNSKSVTCSKKMFGFNLDSFHIEKNIIRKNEFFGSILSAQGMTANLILLLEHEAKGIFNIRNIQAGNKYHVIKRHECDEKPVAIVYEPDKLKYVVYDFRDSVQVKLVEKEVEVCEEFAYGKIESSLWNALEDKGINPNVIDLMEDALSSSVDFYHTRKGDEFKLIFENKYIDGENIGVGRLIAACYTNENGDNYSLLYKTRDNEGYFDSEGRPAKKAFLKAPVKFSRISSNYNLRRFHPIKGRTIPHLGTDYAAPYGTEIRSVADGVISASAYGAGNGNYVKVKHDNVYETQYLHMSRFAKGIRPGARIKQGQTIGYVGSTGLSTGPHVCFRFWKNGRQVNHLKEKLPSALPMNMTELPTYFKHRDQLIIKLNQIHTESSELVNHVSTDGYMVKP